jgi:hypothetical protein
MTRDTALCANLKSKEGFVSAASQRFQIFLCTLKASIGSTELGKSNYCALSCPSHRCLILEKQAIGFILVSQTVYHNFDFFAYRLIYGFHRIISLIIWSTKIIVLFAYVPIHTKSKV